MNRHRNDPYNNTESHLEGLSAWARAMAVISVAVALLASGVLDAETAADAVAASPDSGTAMAAPAASPLAPSLALPLQWTGFVQDWSVVGEQTGNKAHSYDEAGNFLKHFQLGVTANPYPGVSLVMLSELAGQSVTGTGAVYGGTYGMTLLNAYAAVDLSKFIGAAALPLTLTAGQFKTHFGLNRMYRPDQLTLVDYSSIFNGAGGVMGTSTFWDDGMQLAWQRGSLIEADAAWVNGQGPNLTAYSKTMLGQPDQDFVGNLTLTPCKVLKVGASYYYGEIFSTPAVVGFPNKPKSFTDEYTRFALPGKSFAAEVEFVNRSGSGNAALPATVTDGADRNGLTVTLSQYLCDPLQLVFGYDHVIVYGSDAADSTRYLGGFSWYPGGGLRFSLEQEALASGVSQRAAYSESILQSQVSF